MTDLLPTQEIDDDEAEAGRWQRRFDLLAALALAAALSRIVLAGCSAWAQQQPEGQPMPYAGAPGVDWTLVLQEIARSADLLVAGMVIAAFAFLLLGPGEISRFGTTVMRAVVGLGMVAAVLALYAVYGWLSPIDTRTNGVVQYQAQASGNFVARVGQASPSAVAMALLGFAAWCAFQTLGGASAGPDSDDSDQDGADVLHADD